MKSLTIIFMVFVGAIIGARSDPNYKQDLEDAGSLLRSTMKDTLEGSSDLKQQLFQNLKNSDKGRKYFLHALLMAHQILNEPQVKKVLDFLLENGVDIMKVFSINVPSSLWESINKEEEAAQAVSEDDETFGKKLGSLPFQEIHDYIDLPELVTVCVNLLQENGAVQKVWEALSSPNLHKEVKGVITKKEYKEFLGVLGSMFGDASEMSITDVGYGLVKIFNVQGDKRSMSHADRFTEGLKILGNCADADTKLCETLKKLKTKKKTEL